MDKPKLIERLELALMEARVLRNGPAMGPLRGRSLSLTITHIEDALLRSAIALDCPGYRLPKDY